MEIILFRPARDLNGDLGDDDDFVSQVTDLLGARGTHIVIDMAGVGHLSSAGISVLVRVTAQANIQESRVALAAPSPFVSGLLQVTRLHKFFEVHDNVDAAVTAMK